MFQHGQVKARQPTQAFNPGQEAAGGNGFALRVQQASEDFAVENVLRCSAFNHRLEVQLHLALVEGCVDPGAPLVQPLGRQAVEVIDPRPGLAWVALCLGQGLIRTAKYVAGRFPLLECGQPQVSHWRAVGGARLAKVVQAGAEFAGQLVGILTRQARR